MHFIGQEISVELPDLIVLEKKPPAPLAFNWNSERHVVVEMLAEWHRYGKPEVGPPGSRPPYYQRSARLQGSWGVGRTYYRVRTGNRRLFDLYYDRAPKGQERSGTWVLWRELAEEEASAGLGE